jgi:transposase
MYSSCIVSSKKFANFPYFVSLHLQTHYCFGSSFFTHFSIDFAPQIKTRCLTVEERACIIGTHQGGAKDVEIVVALGHPKSTVNIVLKEFEYCGSVEHPKSIGRPKKLSKKSIGIITRELAQNRRQILADITNRSGFNVSGSTVKKVLHDVGFYSSNAQKKPFLSNTHKTRRLEFAREH